MGNIIILMFLIIIEIYVIRIIVIMLLVERNFFNGLLVNMNRLIILVGRLYLVNYVFVFGLFILVLLISLILFLYIRSVRKFGLVSFVVNVVFLVVFVLVVGYMLSGKFIFGY